MKKRDLISRAEQPYKAGPHDLRAEKAFLGHLLFKEGMLELANQRYFHDSKNRRLFEVSLWLRDQKKAVNATELKAYLDRTNELESLGGEEYLKELKESVADYKNLFECSQLIRDLYLKRQLIGHGKKVISKARDKNHTDASEQIEQAIQNLYAIPSEGMNSRGGFMDFRSVGFQASHEAKLSGCQESPRMGFNELDDHLGGSLSPGLWVIGSRNLTELSVLGTNIAFNVAKRCLDENTGEKDVVVLFTPEISGKRHGIRIFSRHLQIPVERIVKGELTSNEQAKLEEAYSDLQELPLFIDDTPAKSILDVFSSSRLLSGHHNVSLLIIDRLQLMVLPSERASNAFDPISALATLADELQIPILILSSLVEEINHEQGKRPRISDLPFACSVEQYALSIMLLHSNRYHLEQDKPFLRANETLEEYAKRFQKWQDLSEHLDNKAELIIAKNCYGTIANIELVYEAECSNFRDSISR